MLQLCSERLKNERKKAKLTQQKLAFLLEVSDMTIKRWETGNTAIPSDKLILMKNLGLDVSYILFGESEQPYSQEEDYLILKYRQASIEGKDKILAALFRAESESKARTNNSSTVHGDQYNAETQTFHRKDSGFTDLPFSLAAFLCAVAAWGLGWLANHIGLTDRALSFDVGVPAILLWVMAIILAVFATERRKMIKNDRLNAKFE